MAIPIVGIALAVAGGCLVHELVRDHQLSQLDKLIDFIVCFEDSERGIFFRSWPSHRKISFIRDYFAQVHQPPFFVRKVYHITSTGRVKLGFLESLLTAEISSGSSLLVVGRRLNLIPSSPFSVIVDDDESQVPIRIIMENNRSLDFFLRLSDQVWKIREVLYQRTGISREVGRLSHEGYALNPYFSFPLAEYLHQRTHYTCLCLELTRDSCDHRFSFMFHCLFVSGSTFPPNEAGYALFSDLEAREGESILDSIFFQTGVFPNSISIISPFLHSRRKVLPVFRCSLKTPQTILQDWKNGSSLDVANLEKKLKRPHESYQMESCIDVIPTPGFSPMEEGYQVVLPRRYSSSSSPSPSSSPPPPLFYFRNSNVRAPRLTLNQNILSPAEIQDMLIWLLMPSTVPKPHSIDDAPVSIRQIVIILVSNLKPLDLPAGDSIIHHIKMSTSRINDLLLLPRTSQLFKQELSEQRSRNSSVPASRDHHPSIDSSLFPRYSEYVHSLETLRIHDYPVEADSEGKDFILTRRLRSRKWKSLPIHRKILGIDCEMCETVAGEELIRVSIMGIDHQVLLDAFVFPEHPVIDYRTDIHGLSEKDLTNAESFANIRSKILDLVSSETILIGHSLEKDLRVLKLVHLKVFDTAIHFPMTKCASPFQKRKLVDLVDEYLKRTMRANTIHDSVEDARACIDLARRKIKKGPTFGIPSKDHSQYSIFELCDLQGMASALIGRREFVHRFNTNSNVSVCECDSDTETMEKLAYGVYSDRLLVAKLKDSYPIGKSIEYALQSSVILLIDLPDHISSPVC